LARLEVDVSKYARRGRFTMYDASDLLDSFMVDGMPNRRLFNESVAKAVIDSRTAAAGHDSRVTVFGEMVALLWEVGNKSGALALEELWNELLSDNAFHLHCAYPRDLLANDSIGMKNICQSHSHILDSLANTA
jgi:hypothetical protein